MIFKADWTEYIHSIKRGEIKKIFDFLDQKKFDSGIEFGAGDGYQTTLLAPHFNDFTSSDLNFSRIKDSQKLSAVHYVKCDADNIDGVFNDKQFDLVFSSSMLEHLSDPGGFLKNTNRILKDTGYGVHIVPNRYLKMAYILFFYVNVCALIFDRIMGLFQGKKIFRGAEIHLENNINVGSKGRERRFKKIFIPRVHGNFRSHTEEFIKFGRKSWEDLFTECGFEIVEYIRGPVTSGYGFGWNKLRILLEKIGLSSVHIFILKKNLF